MESAKCIKRHHWAASKIKFSHHHKDQIKLSKYCSLSNNSFKGLNPRRLKAPIRIREKKNVPGHKNYPGPIIPVNATVQMFIQWNKKSSMQELSPDIRIKKKNSMVKSVACGIIKVAKKRKMASPQYIISLHLHLIRRNR